MTKLGTICYIPGPHIAPDRTRACLRNLGRYEHTHPLYIYSEAKADWLGREIAQITKRGPAYWLTCPDPDILKSPKGPLPKLASPPTSPDLTEWMIPKLSYLHGLAIAVSHDLTYHLTYETDCRVGCDNWDGILFDEFLKYGRGKAVAGGTIFAWSPFNKDMDFAMAFSGFAHFANEPWDTLPDQWKDLPGVIVYGGKGSCQKTVPCVYPNGALSIVETEFADTVFGRSANLEEKAVQGTAWDAAIGYGLVELYGNEVFDRIVPMTRSWSTYGDLLSTEGERIALLKSGQCVAVHQVKSAWEG